jgi:hypothetical protein
MLDGLDMSILRGQSCPVSWYEVRHKKNETNPIAWELRVGGERQRDGYRACSNLSPWDKAQLHCFTQYECSNIDVFLPSVGKCWECKSEQRVNIKFLVKLKKSANGNFSIIDRGLRWRVHVSCTRFWMTQTIFGRQRKRERWSPRPPTHSSYRWQY